jgi:alpha-L-fucosidase 2
MAQLLSNIIVAALLFGQALASKTDVRASDEPPRSDITLWYRQPAAEWVEALPVGNGRLGAMVFGGVETERIQLNEDTVWSGGVRTDMPADISRALPGIRKLLFEGNFAEGEARATQDLLAVADAGGSYQTLGDLVLTAESGDEPAYYRRSLDLDSGIATTTFAIDGVSFRREVFASAPDQVIAVRVTASRPGRVTFAVSLERPDASVRGIAHDTLVMSNAGEQPPGVKFAAAVKAVAEGGTVGADGTRLTVSRANSVTLLLSAATNFNRRDPSVLRDDPQTTATRALASSAEQAYERLRERAIADHRRLFRRVELQLAPGPTPDRPTDERLKAVQAGGEDPHLVELYFQYGRHPTLGAPITRCGRWAARGPHVTSSSTTGSPATGSF